MQELTKNWEEALANLKSKLGETAFSTWIAPLKFSAADNRNISLEAPDQFFKDWVEKHYLALINESLKNAGLDNLLVNLIVGTAKETLPVQGAKEPTLKNPSSSAFLNLNSRYTFEIS
jgi:chromosomal replication initiation ATPase DnaA